MKLDVPYTSQFLDIQDSFWMLRSCGAVSLSMVLAYHGKDMGDIVSFCNKAKEEGGYHMENGWIHDYLLKTASSFGLQATRKENLTTLSEIQESLNSGNPVIVSVEKRLLEQKRFHLLVVVGYDSGNIIYHEPESTSRDRGAFRVCSEEEFLTYWRGKAIFVSSRSA